MRALVVSIRGRTLETEVVPTDATQLNDIEPFSLLSRGLSLVVLARSEKDRPSRVRQFEPSLQLDGDSHLQGNTSPRSYSQGPSPWERCLVFRDHRRTHFDLRLSSECCASLR
jgi:hypothetical protein